MSATAAKVSLEDLRGKSSSSSHVVLDPASLYPGSEVDDGRVFRALDLLNKANAHFEAASQIDAETNYPEFDTELIKARIYLESAFSLRDIGDGFASVINALICGLTNSEVETFSRRQLKIIVDVLSKLKKGPFMHFDSAMLLMDEIEEAGVDIEPRALDAFLPTGEYDENIFRDDSLDRSSFEDSGAPASRERKDP